MISLLVFFLLENLEASGWSYTWEKVLFLFNLMKVWYYYSRGIHTRTSRYYQLNWNAEINCLVNMKMKVTVITVHFRKLQIKYFSGRLVFFGTFFYIAVKNDFSCVYFKRKYSWIEMLSNPRFSWKSDKGG